MFSRGRFSVVSFFRRRAPLLCVALLAACSDQDSASSAGWDGSVLRMDGYTLVQNPSEPLAEGLVAESLWTIAAEPGGADSTQWGDPTALAADDTLIYLLDPTNHTVHVISAAGEMRRRIGSEGRGPGDLARPSVIGVTNAGLVVADGGKVSLEWFTPQGEFIRSQGLGALTLNMIPVSGDSVLVYALLGGDAGWSMHSAELPPAEFAMPGVASPPSAPDGATGATGQVPPCRRSIVVSLVLLQLDCATPLLTTHDMRSGEQRAITLRADTVFATDAELDAFAARIRDQVREVGLPPAQVTAMVDRQVDAQRVKRRMRGVRQDPESGVFLLWEQNPEDLGDGPASAHFLSAEGVYLGRMTFPGPWVDVTMRGGQFVVLSRDPELGLARVGAYRVPVTPGLLGRARRAYSEAVRSRAETAGSE